jgi:hypothetical protein
LAELDGSKGVHLVAADGAEQSVGAAVVVGDTGGAEPGGRGAPPVGEQQTEEERFQEGGVASVQQPGKRVQEML